MDTPANDILNPLTALMRARTGDPRAAAHTLETLPGHAGFSFSFILDQNNHPPQKLVLRLAPPGVKIAGPADIVRQARIMACLRGTAVPVPQVRWFGDEPEFFGRPYSVVEFLGGVKLSDAPFPPAQMRTLARQGMATLAALHALDWTSRRDAFGDPSSLEQELARLDHLLDRPTLDPQVVARAPELRERLRATIPAKPRLGCVHGDFQWANLLFDHNQPIALIDWEIASLGPTLIDVGWVSFFADPESWVEVGEPRVRPLSPDEILQAYVAAAAFPIAAEEVRWFRAFAGYRFGVITCFNLMLHRRGKREDPHWEEIAVSAPRMFERGLELIDQR